MRKIRIVGLALVAMFAFSAIAAASAFAELPVWLVNGLTITEEVAVDSATEGKSLLLEDMNATGGAVDILCEGTDKGVVGEVEGGVLNTMADLVAEVPAEAIKCEFVTAGLCSTSLPLKAEALHLGWLTELELVGTKLRDRIEKDAGVTGEPGWLVECSDIFGIKHDDECTGALNNVSVENATEGRVDTNFDAESSTANCTLGGAGAGLVEGLQFILTVSGLPLTVSEE